MDLKSVIRSSKSLCNVSACIGRVDLKDPENPEDETTKQVSACIGRVDLKGLAIMHSYILARLCLYWQSGFKDTFLRSMPHQIPVSACIGRVDLKTVSGSTGTFTKVSACIGRVDLKIGTISNKSRPDRLCLYWQSGFKGFRVRNADGERVSLPVLAEWI